MIKFLCKEDAYDDDNYSYLFRIAICHGYLNVMEYFLSNQRINILSEDNKVCLVALGCSRGQLDAVKFLVQQGANLHQGGEAALVIAAEVGHFTLVEYLLEQGADLHAQDEGALRGALEKGHFLLALYLVRQGADIRNPKVAEMLAIARGASAERRFLCEALGYS